ncbi:glucan -beta-glucosidase protein [Apiospora kogelbergensis]|uniref:glucan -beta-glucosidase protein n=1 Tax=Apiospora kogelbergensis TaxID=1337665 RepID=UPI00312D66F6
MSYGPQFYWKSEKPWDRSIQTKRQPLFARDDHSFHHKEKRGRPVGRRELSEKHYSAAIHSMFFFGASPHLDNVLGSPPQRPYPKLPAHRSHYHRNCKGQRRWLQDETSYDVDDLMGDMATNNPNMPYMVDNQHDFFNWSPSKGTQDGAFWQYSGSFDNFMKNLHAGNITRGGHGPGLKPVENDTSIVTKSTLDNRGHPSQSDSSSYWLAGLAQFGSQPLAGSDYKFFRNVVEDYKADNTGDTDTTESINAAIQDGSRCGKDCGSTTTKGAIVYFPAGTYKICSPIIQFYYTQFIGDPNNPRTGKQWYINQNQYFRHIRNFVFDMTDMPLSTADNDQAYVPTGIHWQAAQATSLENFVFNMPNATDVNSTTHTGIFMENGSGGFVSDLVCIPPVGSSKYHAHTDSVQMVWDWGFNWHGVEVHGGAIGFNISGKGGDGRQGIGSVSLIDCSISDVPTAILTNGLDESPNIVLDNLQVNNVGNVVQVDGGQTLLNVGTSPYLIHLWAAGKRYSGSEGSSTSGSEAHAPPKGAGLLDADGKLYSRSRPQYEDLQPLAFLVATLSGIANDGTGDQAGIINAFLQNATEANMIAYFPAGIYQVGSTVLVPTGCRIQGSSWSQIRGAGFYFADMHNPKVMVQVGQKGEVGNVEIVEMLFTVAGSTAGAILMEWNVAAASQGSAAMWDSHFRVGGAAGTSLSVADCPSNATIHPNCFAASMMLHVTQQASGYFENVWAWVADHDNDFSGGDPDDVAAKQVSVYGARGILVESEGPSWFYGSSSEHSVLYNYQFYNAKNVGPLSESIAGHLQTESPYFQPGPVAPQPFAQAKSFAGDPSFDDCTSDLCRVSWGMRVIDSTNVTVHGAGLYSFFNEYKQNCTGTYNCQERILEVQGSNNVAVFNLYTQGVTKIASGINHRLCSGTSIFQNDTNQRGTTTEVSIWLPLNGTENADIVYVGPEIWKTPSVSCSPPCILVLPTSPLSSSSTIEPGNYTTSLEYGSPGTTTIAGGQVITTFIITTTVVTIDIPPFTIGGMPYYNLNITSTATGGGFVAEPSVELPHLTLPPWPKISQGPPDGLGWPMPKDPFSIPGPPRPPHGAPDISTSDTFFMPFRTSLSIPGPTATTFTLPSEPISITTVACPPTTELAFDSPKTTVTLDPRLHTTFSFGYLCPVFVPLTFLGPFSGFYDIDCTFNTFWNFLTLPPPAPKTTHSFDPLDLPPVTVSFGGGAGGAPATTFSLEGYGGGPSAPTVTIGGVEPGATPQTFVLPWFLQPKMTTSSTESTTVTLPPGFLGLPSTTLSMWGAGGGPPPATLTIGGAPAPDGSSQSTVVPFGKSGFMWWAPATTVTLTEPYQATTVTVYPPGDEFPWAIAVTLNGENGTQSRTITFADGGLASPTTITLTEPTTLTLGETPTRTDPLPVWQTWPAGEIYPIYNKDDPETEGYDDGPKIHCIDFLLFKWCPSGITFPKLWGWHINFPPGVYPPGPPPGGILNLPNIQFKISGNLPDWPKITIGWDNKMTYNSEEYSTSWCEPLETTMETAITTTATPTSTTSSSTSSSSSACQPTASGNMLVCLNDAIVYPKDPEDVGEIPDILTNYTSKYHTVAANELTGFYWVPALDHETYLQLMDSPDVDGVDYYEQRNVAFPGATDDTGLLPDFDPGTYNVRLESPDNLTRPLGNAVSRARITPQWIYWWEVAVPSLPYFQPMCSALSYTCAWDKTNAMTGYTYYSDPDGGYDSENERGWTVYVISENGTFINHNRITFDTSFSSVFILRKLDRKGIVMVAASGNFAIEEGRPINAWPARFAAPNRRLGYLKNMIVVGATTENGTTTEWGQESPWMTTFAPAQRVHNPSDPANHNREPSWYHFRNGTSFAAPNVAGVVAYWRSLPGPFHEALKKPANVKKLVTYFHHRYDIIDYPTLRKRQIAEIDKRPVIWNGQVQWFNYSAQEVQTMSCLKDWDTRGVWDYEQVCAGLDPNMDEMPDDDGQSVDPEDCSVPADESISLGSSRGSSCERPPVMPDEQSLTFSSATVAQPTCSAAGACGGTLCSGYYCAPSPSGTPPDHQDPQDPNNGQPVSSSTVSVSWSTEPPAPAALSSWTSIAVQSSTSTAPSDTGTDTPTGTTSAGPAATTDCDDQCKLDNGYPCNCNEDGCDDQSPSCCSTATCPLCFCSDTDCTPDSPTCCNTQSCQWSWTGGGGGNKKAAISRQLSDRLAGLGNSSTAVYGLWSHHTNDTNGLSMRIAGYNGRMTAGSVCKESPVWSAASALLGNDTKPDAGLLTWYSNLTVFGDTCSYLAGVSSYASVAAGAKVGALTCSKWSTANCFRANHTNVHDCGTERVAQELVCQF